MMSERWRTRPILNRLALIAGAVGVLVAGFFMALLLGLGIAFRIPPMWILWAICRVGIIIGMSGTGLGVQLFYPSKVKATTEIGTDATESPTPEATL